MERPQGQVPVKKKRSGCVTALLIVGAGVLVIGGVVAIGLVIFFRSDDGRKLLGIVGAGAKMGQEAQRAPGTTELKTLGCINPSVMDLEKFAKEISEYVDSGDPAAKGGVLIAVVCPAKDPKPSCDDVAQTYVKAVGTAAHPFSVQVSGTFGGESCRANYQTDGTKK